MSWFEDLMGQMLGLNDPPPRQIEQSRRPANDAVFDPRSPNYQAGANLHDQIERIQLSRESDGTRRTRMVQQKRHHINDNEYIDTQTFIEIEEGSNYREWGY